MDHRDQPIAIVADVENHIAIDLVGVLEPLPHFFKVVPAHGSSNRKPGSYLAGSIRVLPDGFGEMTARHNMHSLIYFTFCEVVK